MSAQLGINYVIYITDESGEDIKIAGQRGASLSIQKENMAELHVASTKSSSSIRLGGDLNWGVASDALLIMDDRGLELILDSMENNRLLNIHLKMSDSSIWSGKVVADSINLNMDVGDLATYSATFLNYGKLNRVPIS